MGYVCIGKKKNIVYRGFDTIHSFRHLLGGLGTYPLFDKEGILCWIVFDFSTERRSSSPPFEPM